MIVAKQSLLDSHLKITFRIVKSIVAILSLKVRCTFRDYRHTLVRNMIILNVSRLFLQVNSHICLFEKQPLSVVLVKVLLSKSVSLHNPSLDVLDLVFSLLQLLLLALLWFTSTLG